MSEGVVRTSVSIGAQAGDVWDALVDPTRLEDWFADEVDVDDGELRAGSEVLFRWDDGTERAGVVDEVDAPRRLAFRWADGDGEETEVVFELDEEEAGGTRVTVVERRLTVRSAAGRALSWAPRLAALRLAACGVAA